MKKIMLVLFISFIGIRAFAQYNFHGKVISNEDKKPLQGVSVSINKKTIAILVGVARCCGVGDSCARLAGDVVTVDYPMVFAYHQFSAGKSWTGWQLTAGYAAGNLREAIVTVLRGNYPRSSKYASDWDGDGQRLRRPLRSVPTKELACRGSNGIQLPAQKLVHANRARRGQTARTGCGPCFWRTPRSRLPRLAERCGQPRYKPCASA